MKATLAMIIAAAFVLGACNTVEGVGKDIEAGGEKVQETAEEVKREM
ncbi:MAG: entericidin A/B family lipoprotein [Rhodocyclaceae bacterium]|nr:entericidin A/B family lipoprotein [Rhodocyclaceae bacterium]